METKKLNYNEPKEKEPNRQFHLSSMMGFDGLQPASLGAVASIIDNSPERRKWVDSQFAILKRRIEEFEQDLDKEHEVGMLLASFGQSVLMNVVQIEYEYPVLFVFKGYVDGEKSTLIQHINQLNFLLKAVEKEKGRAKRKIGFSIQTEKE